MQALILEFPTESFTMTKTDDHLDELQRSVQSIDARLKNVEKTIDSMSPPKPTPLWASIVGPLVGALVASAAIGATLWTRFDTKFDGLNTSIAAVNQRIDKLDSAVLVLKNQQSQQVQELSDQAVVRKMPPPRPLRHASRVLHALRPPAHASGTAPALCRLPRSTASSRPFPRIANDPFRLCRDASCALTCGTSPSSLAGSKNSRFKQEKSWGEGPKRAAAFGRPGTRQSNIDV